MAHHIVDAAASPRMGAFNFGDAVACPFPTLTAAFYHQALLHPNSKAVRDLSGNSPRDLTYYELSKYAQALACRLRNLGVQPGQRIPLVVKRGLEMVVGIWAILSCGAQYVPLDGGVVPDSSIKQVVEQSGERIVVCLSTTEHRTRRTFPHVPLVLIDECMRADARYSTDQWVDLATPESGCYVIYTSGTTGKPKGIDVTHRNVTNLVCLGPGNLGISDGMRVGQVLNISFDMAAWEIFACLCNGGTLMVRGSQWEPTIRQLHVLICTPTILAKYHPTKYPNIKVVATAGEPTSQDLADLWASHATYWNCCGPTETTIVNTMSKHLPGTPVSIGRPTPNNSVYILDGNGRPVPIGQPGMMWAGGRGVSRGYVGLEAKTKESYVPNPFVIDGSYMYCTGDLGQWRQDGSIEILGRGDDQVKVKGFRVELDGIASSLASAPGVSRATTLLIDGDLYGFVVPQQQNVEAVLQHTSKLQPYYAIPTAVFPMDEFPTTANGKIDKKALRVLAAQPQVDEPRLDTAVTLTSQSPTYTETVLEEKLASFSPTEKDVSDTFDLTQELPSKQLPRPLRGLRYRIFIVYRLLFSLTGLLNVGALVAIVFMRLGPEWLGTLTAANLVLAVLIRQDMVINALYTVFCSVPKAAPLWLRSSCAKVYHLGGVHSSAGVCATLWLLSSTIASTTTFVQGHNTTDSMATLVISWLLSAILSTMVFFAWPSIRRHYHDVFENMHRFLGWTALFLFWVRTFLSIEKTKPLDQDLGVALLRSPQFWIITVASLSIASSWFFLRRVSVEAIPLSEHAMRLHFSYTQPTNGSFTRISTRPLFEWHSFATIPNAKTATSRGFSLIMSNAGDWTKSQIQKPPTKLWVRGTPTCGVMRIATLFNRIVVIATGSGIGPLLGHIAHPSCPTQLIWSTSSPDTLFGQDILNVVHRSIPNAIIHNTKKSGRPDLVRMGYNLAKSFNAEAVIIIANEKITKKVVYGLETRGVPAYGAIWDS
ncbi:AMP-binding enzyme [Hirsutella rhossiliensis]|uniref:AMP-binding enzyme domain-containing protein n=1 Tax=Hirsutella rhossiliensis TaxID=111463 RepID=A0A9P8N2Q4_9HYPO|nr:AMP-binding enzyme domain-containing protein [Hirsutella rhossiliensis]KAH0964769.1 AMP-binding enzyme domain-containing protein [Hirsutella rhossiliensis]